MQLASSIYRPELAVVFGVWRLGGLCIEYHALLKGTADEAQSVNSPHEIGVYLGYCGMSGGYLLALETAIALSNSVAES